MANNGLVFNGVVVQLAQRNEFQMILCECTFFHVGSLFVCGSAGWFILVCAD